MDTVDMKGKGFAPKVAAGDRVTAGQLLMEFDMDEIKKAGHSTTTAFVVTNSEDYGGIHLGVGRKYAGKAEIGSVKK